MIIHVILNKLVFLIFLAHTFAIYGNILRKAKSNCQLEQYIKLIYTI